MTQKNAHVASSVCLLFRTLGIQLFEEPFSVACNNITKQTRAGVASLSLELLRHKKSGECYLGRRRGVLLAT